MKGLKTVGTTLVTLVAAAQVASATGSLPQEADNSSRCPDGGYQCEVNGELTCDCPGWGASLPCNPIDSPQEPQEGEFDPHNYEGLIPIQGIVLLPIS